VARRLAVFAWVLLGYTIAVILWGAYVRATGSGAGCGSHWPLCNGEVIPRIGSEKTAIELTHRVTSGLAWLGAGLFAWLARRVHPPGHLARSASAAVAFFMTTEALVGAGLVLFEMVADNPSTARGGWMAAHLVNTFLLVASLTVAVHACCGGARPAVRGRGLAAVLLGATTLLALLVGVSGAIAALGDTLFPSATLGEALAADASPASHLFVRLRVLHPLLALGVAGLSVVLAGWLAITREDGNVRQLAAVLVGLVALQVGVGLANVALLAPVWLQLVHHALADGIFVSLVALGLSTLADEPAAVTAPADQLASTAT
jgi:cytochrome c oxidase assembly protein subunit 15